MKTTFVDKNPSTGATGTIITADFLNAINSHYHDGLALDGHGALPYAADMGVANAYVITLTPVLSQYVVGMPLFFKADSANTGTSTLNVNGLGVVTLKKQGNVNLVEGDIVAGQLVGVVYDGQNFQLITPTALNDSRPGDIKLSTLATPPSDGLKLNGATLSRTSYAALFANAVPTKTVTISIASPGVFTTSSAHGLLAGDRIRLATTGVLPTGLSVNTDYYVLSVLSTTTFTVATSVGGTALTTTGSTSGTHTISIWRGYGPGDGAATFTLPDFRGYAIRVWDDGAGVDSGRLLGSLQADAMQGHFHSTPGFMVTGGGIPVGVFASDIRGDSSSGTGAPITDGTNGTPRIGSETRMKNASICLYVKF